MSCSPACPGPLEDTPLILEKELGFPAGKSERYLPCRLYLKSFTVFESRGLPILSSVTTAQVTHKLSTVLLLLAVNLIDDRLRYQSI